MLVPVRLAFSPGYIAADYKPEAHTHTPVGYIRRDWHNISLHIGMWAEDGRRVMLYRQAVQRIFLARHTIFPTNSLGMGPGMRYGRKRRMFQNPHGRIALRGHAMRLETTCCVCQGGGSWTPEERTLRTRMHHGANRTNVWRALAEKMLINEMTGKRTRVDLPGRKRRRRR